MSTRRLSIPTMAFMVYFLLAIVLVGCYSGEEIMDTPESTGIIKAQITLSLSNSTKGSVQTRQSAEIVQKAQTVGSFRGIRNVRLLPFVTSDNNGVVTTSTRNGDNLVLPIAGAVPSIPTANSINSIVSLRTNGNNAQTYADVDIWIGTNAFLFYGEATPKPDDIADDDLTANHINGAISEYPENLTAGTPANIRFSLVPIWSNDAATPEGATNVASYLTEIAKADGWSSSTGNLSELYNNFKKIKAGSSANMKAVVQLLYDNLKNRPDNVSKAIVNKIKTKATPDANGKLTFDSTVDNYPANVYLPDGAASIVWNTDHFAPQVGTNYISNFTISKRSDYVYPAPLYYWGNTRIKTSLTKMTSETTSEDVYAQQSTWDGVLSQYSTDNGSILSSTKSVALKNPVNYAVGRLDVMVKPSAASIGDFNNTASFNVGTGSVLFPVTGVLIGGQQASVDWQFLPIANAGSKTIYDCDISGMYLRLENSENNYVYNHTLTFETNKDEQVYIAVEFRNDSEDFITTATGALIYPGCKFYLVGLLDPTDTSSNTIRPSTGFNYAFKQDYVTTAKLNVSSLQNAYNTLPDLRLPQLELGLSVNLSWQTGITQTIEIE